MISTLAHLFTILYFSHILLGRKQNMPHITIMNENINCDRITKKIIFTKLSHTWTIFFVKQNSGGCFHINTYVSSSLLILYGIKDEAGQSRSKQVKMGQTRSKRL